MKNIKRIFALILSIFLVFVSLSHYTLVVYASDHGGAGGSDRETTSQKRWKDVKSGAKTAWEAMKEDGLEKHIMFVVSNLGAIVTLDFAKLIENSNVFDENFINKNVTVDDDGNIVYSKELIDYIKQALREYAEETCGFFIIPSTHYMELQPSNFSNGNMYNTVSSFVKEYGLIAVCRDGSTTINIYDFSDFIDGSAGLYLNGNKSDYESRTYYRMYGLNMTQWTNPQYKYARLRYSEVDTVLKTWEELEDFSNRDDVQYTGILSTSGNVMFNIYKSTYFSAVGSNPEIISKDGRNILIFNSKTALQNYSVDHRSIYFGSKFYEDSGEITAAFEDLQNYLDGKYDDFLEKLKEMIGGSNLSEDDIEKIVDKLLDQMKDVDDSVGEVNDSLKETNNLLEQILDALYAMDETVEYYLSAILEQLGLISYQLEDMTVEQAEEKTDSLLSTLISAFSEIVDVAKVKFPLSIPWDIYGILSALGGMNNSSELYESVSAVYSSDDGIVLFSNKNDEGIMPLSVHTLTTNDILTVPAPRFELPLVIESWDIDERIIVDLSDFEVVSQISRSMFSCIFAVILMNLTFKVVDFGKDLFS